jgi:hypothetical protein
MKRSFNEANGIDIAVHAKVCLKYFQLVVHPHSANTSESVKDAVSVIYEGKVDCANSQIYVLILFAPLQTRRSC